MGCHSVADGVGHGYILGLAVEYLRDDGLHESQISRKPVCLQSEFGVRSLAIIVTHKLVGL